MDNKVLDEAVEVAARAGAEAYARQIGETLAHEPDPDDLVAMRAALIAGVKVLLGELVATLRYDHTDGWWIDWEIGMPAGYESVEVYAPSLGEGK